MLIEGIIISYSYVHSKPYACVEKVDVARLQLNATLHFDCEVQWGASKIESINKNSMKNDGLKPTVSSTVASKGTV